MLPYSRSTAHTTVGTIGNSSHGKTTLTKAILSLLARSGKAKLAYNQMYSTLEEYSEGYTMNLTYHEYYSTHRHYTHIDCPGHVAHINNTMAGASQMNTAILVVSALEGCKAQTEEHLLLARQMGVSRVVVYLNKCDINLSAERLEDIEQDIRRLLDKYAFLTEDTVIIRGSALFALDETNESIYGTPSIYQLLKTLDQVPHIKNTDSPFLMPIESVATSPEKNIVLKGTILKGSISVGDALEVIGSQGTIGTSVLGIEVIQQQFNDAWVGENVAITLQNLQQVPIERGMILAKPNQLKANNKFKATIYLLRQEEGGRNSSIITGSNANFYFWTTAVTGAFTALSTLSNHPVTQAIPGETIVADIMLTSNSVLVPDLRIVLREGGKTIGIGWIIKVID